MRLALTAVLILPALAAAQFADPAQPPAAPAVVPQTAPLTPPGYVLVEESVWLQFTDLPQQYMTTARQRLAAGDGLYAAADIRKIVGFLQISVANAQGATVALLDNSVRELSVLADQVQRGVVTDPAALDRPFARAERALADFHYQRARQLSADAGRNMDTPQVVLSRHMQAAAYHTEASARWAGEKLEGAAASAVSGARQVGGALTRGAGWTIEGLGKGIEEIGEAARGLGRRIDPQR